MPLAGLVPIEKKMGILFPFLLGKQYEYEHFPESFSEIIYSSYTELYRLGEHFKMEILCRSFRLCSKKFTKFTHPTILQDLFKFIMCHLLSA